MSQDYSTVSAVANRIFQEPLADLINRHNPVLTALTKKAVSSDRIYMKAQLSSDHGAAPVADGATITLAGTERTSYIPPTLDWATYAAKFRVPKRALEQMSSQPGALGRLLQTEIESAAKDLSDRIAADVFAGSVTDGLVGLQAMVDNANTYAGIDRSLAANANWRSVVINHSNGGTPAAPQELSTEVLYQADEEYFAANGYGFVERPGLFTGVTDRLLMTKYKSLMESIDLSALSTAHFVNQANGSGQLGYGAVGFAGVPFIRDRNVVAGAGDLASSSRLYIFDMNQIHLCILEPNSEAAMIHQVEGFTAAPEASGIRAKIEFLGNAGEFVAGYVKAYVQLASASPKAAGLVIKNIKNN